MTSNHAFYADIYDVLCFSLCSCGKEYDQAMDLLELVENYRFDETHELLNEMAGEDATKWVPDYYISDNDIDDSWVYDDSCDIYGDSCGDIGSGSDFWNGDDTDETPDGDTEPAVDEPKEIPIEGINLNRTELSMEVLEKIELFAAAYPENTTEYPETIIWTSSDETVAKVNEWSGLVTGVGKGTAVITATMGAHTATCSVTVSNPTISTVEELLAIENIDSGIAGGHHAGYLIDCYYLASKSPEGSTREGAGDGKEDNYSSARVTGLSDSNALLRESYPTLDFENV